MKPAPMQAARASKNGSSTKVSPPSEKRNLEEIEKRLTGYLLDHPEDCGQILEQVDDFMFPTCGPVIDSIRFKLDKYGTFEPDEIADDLMRQGHTDLMDAIPDMLMNPSAKPFTDAGTLIHIHEQSLSDSVSLADITETEVTYEWPGRIPNGKITIIAGIQGDGKTLVATDIAAKKSAGITWPDGSPNQAGRVLLMNGEDDASDTTIPRARAAGANLNNMYSLEMITKVDPEDGSTSEAIPTLTEDLEAIRREIQIRKPSILIIDPINAFLPGVDTHRDADLRSKVFAPLKNLAEDQNVAVIGIMHLNKSVSQSAIHRVSGSIAYTAAARAAYLLTEDKNQPGRKLVLPLKFNCGPKPDGMAFKIMQNEEGHPIVAWERDPVDIDADEALKSDNTSAPERAEAKDFLLQILADGPVLSKDIFAEAEDLDISKSTLKRAKDRLPITAERKGVPGKKGGGKWYWKLTENDD